MNLNIMVSFTYKSIENQHDNMPNWYRPEIDSKVLKGLMKRRNLPGLINNFCYLAFCGFIFTKLFCNQ